MGIPDASTFHAWLAIVLKLTAATIIGGVIGLERHRNGHPAGMRTFAMITLTSTFLTASLSQGPFGILMGENEQGASRVIQGILQGIGFIGAGVIVREGFSIKGLTSAATIWSVASIGILIGTGAYAVAAAATVFTYLILIALKEIEPAARRHYSSVAVTFTQGSDLDEAALRARFALHGFQIATVGFCGQASGHVQVKAQVWSSGNAAGCRSELARALLEAPDVDAFQIEPVQD
jgi:putative Mg2+ transporter-C (MgtC) family protein